MKLSESCNNGKITKNVKTIIKNKTNMRMH